MPDQPIIIPDNLRGAKILIVDDSEVNRKLLQRTFMAYGLGDIREAEGGREALELLGSWQPDLMLLDLMMPEVDGEAVCSAMQDMKLGSPPIVIVQTARTELVHKRRLFALGVTDYVTKPLDIGELIARSVAHLEKRELTREMHSYNQQISNTIQEAAVLQMAIMPTLLQQSEIESRYGVELASHYKPSEEMGGDFWGLRALDDACFAVYLADFSGHGLLAALNTFRLQAMMAEAKLDYHMPHRLLKQLNQRLCQLLPPGQFATMIYMVVNTRERSYTVANAGSLPPLVIGVAGEIYNPKVSGLPLGYLPNAGYKSVTLDYAPGDMLLLASDGLAECQNTGADLLDNESLRMLAANRLTSGEPLAAVMGEIVQSCNVQAAAHGASRVTDDETAVLVACR